MNTVLLGSEPLLGNYFLGKISFSREKNAKSMYILDVKNLAYRGLFGLRFEAHLRENVFGGHIFV